MCRDISLLSISVCSFEDELCCLDAFFLSFWKVDRRPMTPSESCYRGPEVKEDRSVFVCISRPSLSYPMRVVSISVRFLVASVHGRETLTS